jgi:hypothetical protein
MSLNTNLFFKKVISYRNSSEKKKKQTYFKTQTSAEQFQNTSKGIHDSRSVPPLRLVVET